MSDQMPWVCWRDPSHPVTTHPVFGWPQCVACGAAPAYHERPDYLPADLRLPVYVPVPGARWAGTTVVAGSAIVGTPDPSGERTAVYYEGWVHSAGQYASRDARGKWAAGVEHAAGRMVTDYPTIAVAALPVTDLVQVGTYDPATRQVDVADEAALGGWLATREDWS